MRSTPTCSCWKVSVRRCTSSINGRICASRRSASSRVKYRGNESIRAREIATHAAQEATDWLRRTGMRFYARHGVHADERELGQTYRVDVALAHDLSRAGRTDELEDAIDYGAVFALVREVVEGEPRQLVESVA